MAELNKTETYTEFVSSDDALNETSVVRKHYNEMLEKQKHDYERRLADKDKLIVELRDLLYRKPRREFVVHTPPYGS